MINIAKRHHLLQAVTDFVKIHVGMSFCNIYHPCSYYSCMHTFCTTIPTSFHNFNCFFTLVLDYFFLSQSYIKSFACVHTCTAIVYTLTHNIVTIANQLLQACLYCLKRWLAGLVRSELSRSNYGQKVGVSRRMWWTCLTTTNTRKCLINFWTIFVFVFYMQIPELAWHAFLLHRPVECKAMTTWALMCINKLACTVLMQSS